MSKDAEISVVSEHNVRCPDCQKDDGLEIDVVIETSGLIVPTGVEVSDDAIRVAPWDTNTSCRCRHCGWNGLLRDCEILLQVPEVA